MRFGINIPYTAIYFISSFLQACRNPSGGSCSWYRDCLHKFNPCTGSGSDEYALNYGNNYCNVYENNLQKFSPQGQQWVGKVRKCLQVALKDAIGTKISCSDLKKRAFNSHTKCYADSGFCSLCFDDYKAVFKLVKGAFVPFSGSSWLSFWNGVATAGGCVNRDARWRIAYAAFLAIIGTAVIG